MAEAVAESEALHDRVEPHAVCVAAGDVDRQSDVLDSGQGWNEIEGLEDKPYPVTSQLSELLVIEDAKVLIADEYLPRGQVVESGHAMHQRGLTRPAGAHDCGVPALLKLNRHAVDCGDGGVA